MATFDQLPADQRAIIELVVQRGQTYEELSELLGMSAPRVRELARGALADLTPATARRVDDDWRAQVADYVLGQQSGPESRATRGHLKRSEPARTWALSLVDALDGLYGNGTRPDIPEGELRPARTTRPREERGERAGRTTRPRERTTRPLRAGGPLSPAARDAVRRRRLAAAAAGLAVVLFAVLVWPISLVVGGDDEDDTEQAAEATPRIVGSPIVLSPVGDGGDASGVGVVAERGDERVLIVQAQGLEPTEQPEGEDDSGTAYEVWLYNSREEAVSLGAQLTDEDGNFQGAGPIPPNVNIEDFRFLDVSRERIDSDAGHSGNSVLRGEIADLRAPPQQGAGGGQQGGGEQQGGGGSGGGGG